MKSKYVSHSHRRKVYIRTLILYIQLPVLKYLNTQQIINIFHKLTCNTFACIQTCVLLTTSYRWWYPRGGGRRDDRTSTTSRKINEKSADLFISFSIYIFILYLVHIFQSEIVCIKSGFSNCFSVFAQSGRFLQSAQRPSLVVDRFFV